MKPDDVQIIQIAVPQGDSTIYGLGSDSNVYMWNSMDGGWKLHTQE